jgi:hypothetical protein
MVLQVAATEDSDAVLLGEPFERVGFPPPPVVYFSQWRVHMLRVGDVFRASDVANCGVAVIIADERENGVGWGELAIAGGAWTEVLVEDMAEATAERPDQHRS